MVGYVFVRVCRVCGRRFLSGHGNNFTCPDCKCKKCKRRDV